MAPCMLSDRGRSQEAQHALRARLGSPRRELQGGLWEILGLAMGLAISPLAASANDCVDYEDYCRVVSTLSNNLSSAVDVAVTPEILGQRYAYIAHGDIRLIDVYNPTAPLNIRDVGTPGTANGVTVNGSYLYVADGTAGLAVFDITLPLWPEIAGTGETPGTAQDVVVVGTVAYIADGEAGLTILDVSNPHSPTFMGGVANFGEMLDIAVAGSYAYLANNGGFMVADISDPSSPVIVAEMLPGVWVNGVALSPPSMAGGDYAYVAGSSAFFVMDISIPTSPPS